VSFHRATTVDTASRSNGFRVGRRLRHEPAGAAATAAAMKLHAELAGLRVVLPITGGNATAEQLIEALRT
jgi:threonine dehydratase